MVDRSQPDTTAILVGSLVMLGLNLLALTALPLYILWHRQQLIREVLYDFDITVPAIPMLILNTPASVFIASAVIVAIGLVVKEVAISQKVWTLLTNIVVFAALVITFCVYREAMGMVVVELMRSVM